MNDLDDRIRLTARVLAKRELEGATKCILSALGQADALTIRTGIEHLMLDVLSERVDRTAHDPVSRIRL